ncbi:MAG: hypothetical protein QM783_02130 [Phycisphaerales bacterium]
MLSAICLALGAHDDHCPGPFDLRVFSGVMGYFPTDMGAPGLAGCTKTAWPTHDVDARWERWSDVERCFDQLASVAASVTGQVGSGRVLVLWVDCHGGWDGCRVAVYEQGRSSFERTAHNDVDAYVEAITEGVALLGVRLKDGYFPPLEKGAFGSLGRAVE